MLSQAWYWKDHTDDGWFWKTREQWWSETCLTRFEQETARRALRDKGFMEEDLRGMPAKTYFRINIDAVLDAISREVSSRPDGHPVGGEMTNKVAAKQPAGRRRRNDQQGGGEMANMAAAKSPAIIPETTSETTSETTRTARARVSRFDLATCERYARTLRGLRSPDGYAKTIWRSGDDDDKIAAWVASGAQRLAASGEEGAIARTAAAEGRPVEEVAEEFAQLRREIAGWQGRENG